uniref:Uncharacterized protein n=1 Tax=viral metagenome TaxID=1070528 RepID=A0A6M3LPS0_9ZZZZ
MANIAKCSVCGGLYEAGSEEQANEDFRACPDCRKELRHYVVRLFGEGWREANACIANGEDAMKLFFQACNDLEPNPFTRGWKARCYKEINDGN